MVLAGLEKHVKGILPARVTSRTLKYPKGDNVKFSRKINIVRYADDFVITCRNKVEARALIEGVNAFLKARGLELNPVKTKITDVHDGFNFLGFHFKHYKNRKLLVTPSKEAKKNIRDRIKEIRTDKPSLPTTAHLIKKLNPVLRG